MFYRLRQQYSSLRRLAQFYWTTWGAGRAMEETALWNGHPQQESESQRSNPLREYFESHREGPGIWKWRHYFDAYHRHFQKFIGREVHVVEIGIYSGGSLGMWHNYFGPRCHVYGVDIEEACRTYESDSTRVFIGDQADRRFWKQFKAEVPRIDIIIDDGGHTPEQQQVTFEELLPHLYPGGVYMCEDAHGSQNQFLAYMSGLVQQLNESKVRANPESPERRLVSATSPFQSAVHSIHFYPYLFVLEKMIARRDELVAPKHGTQWQPFRP